MNINISEELDLLISGIAEIPATKKYWLIRTRSGSLYDTFRENNFVGIDHIEVSLQKLNYISNITRDEVAFNNYVKSEVANFYTNLNTDEKTSHQKIGLISGQISRFYKEVKKGDIVIIPSESSELVSFGEITESIIANFTPQEIRKIDITFFLNKRVKWLTEYQRWKLDPYIFKMFTIHQAISDVSSYAQIIERSLTDFFILGHETNYIINVGTENVIKARDLFGLGDELLNVIDEIAKEFNLEGVNSDDMEVTINLNSPGKINLKSKCKKLTFLAGLILLIAGGGYKSREFSVKTDGIPGILNVISKFLDSRHKRKMAEQEAIHNQQMQRDIFNTYKNDLKVQKPEDMIKLLKQMAENKDIPK